MAHPIREGARLALGVLLAVGCGNGDDLDANADFDVTREPVEILPAPPYPLRPQQPAVDEGAMDVDPDGAGGGDAVGMDGPGEGDEPARDPSACVTPTGVSGAPRTISQALVLMNSLPKPVSLACFLQTLSRPLSLYMTSSSQSLQPSPGERSPRTFIVYEPLVMSIVLDGPAKIALELGYRTTPSRSVKTEIYFPLQTDVTFDNVFDAVRNGSLTRSRCGACHTGEVVTLNEDLPVDVFESDILPPYDIYEVELPALRAEHESCDAVNEPERCALLSAIFDFGEVRTAPEGFMF